MRDDIDIGDVIYGILGDIVHAETTYGNKIDRPQNLKSASWLSFSVKKKKKKKKKKGSRYVVERNAAICRCVPYCHEAQKPSPCP
jgi:hypothetical protein